MKTIVAVKKATGEECRCCNGSEAFTWGFILDNTKCWLGNPLGRSRLCPQCAENSHGIITEEHIQL